MATVLALSNGAMAAMLDGFDGLVNTGAGTANFTVYQGNTALCVFPLANPAFGAAAGSGMAVSGAPISSTGTEVAGKANGFRIVDRNAVEVLRGTISSIGGGGDIETPSLTVTAAATQTLNSFTLRLSTQGTLSIEGSLTLV
jgi:hypothetical protein